MSGYTVRNCGNYAHLIDDCANVTLVDNINDYVTDDRYPTQVMDLLDHGCRVDVIGSQMHLFKPNESANIAAGEGPKFLTPDGLDATFKRLSRTLPPRVEGRGRERGFQACRCRVKEEEVV